MAQVAQVISSERTRSLQSLTFAENQILSRDLPRDTVLKFLQLRLSGSVITTFGSGTPVADAQSTFDNIIPRIDVIVDGSRTVKSVRPHLMHAQAIMAMGVDSARRSSAGAAAATDNFPTADGAFAYGTTTQVSTVAESILVAFENVYAYQGGEATWLNLKGVSSAEIRLTTASFSKLLGFGNTAPVAYSGSTLAIEISTIEAQEVAPEMRFADWKQTTKQITFSAETTDYAIDVNRGNSLQAIMMFAQDGAAGSATSASGKLATNLGITKVQMLINGQTSIKATNFKAIQDDNRARYGIVPSFVSNVSRLDGIARLDFLRSGNLNTALSLRAPLVDNAQLVVSTNNASNVSYTNPVSLTLMTEEIVDPR